MSEDRLRAIFALCLVAYTATVIVCTLKVSKSYVRAQRELVSIDMGLAATAAAAIDREQPAKE